MEKKIISLRMLLGALHYCASWLIKLKPDYKERIAKINAILQWKSEPEGPNTYTIIKDGAIDFNEDGIHDNPDFTMISKDLDQALEIFKGRYLLSDAIKNGDVEVTGNKDELLKITFYLEELVPLLGELTGG
ncbi:MAG: SCP2 sterol-binding domain-containing protein [Candidatus Helarchaeota archaeon]